ncbi:MAG TPA: C4-dicarboxylate ABC transporter [Gammaproteobacteria bacterium]|nr:C4-dicarboxylate ABC transporter [Gammaproteobacteria bacterium]
MNMSISTLVKTLAVVTLLGVGSAAHAVTLKIATQAPDGTTWMKDMRAAGKEIAEKTDGRVKIKYYPGGVMGNYKSVMKKIRIGQLHGGAVTGDSLANLYPDMGTYGLPMLFNNYAEADYVRSRLDPSLIKGIQDKGFTMLGITEGGFAYLMSNGPVRSIADLKTHKLWIPEGDALNEALFRKMGVNPISLPLSDVYTGLQTGLIDTIGSTTAGALAFQWHTRIKSVTEVPLLYIVGVLIVEKKRFDRIKPADQEIVKTVITRVFKDMNQKNRIDNDKAKQALKKLGIEFVRPDAQEETRWKQIAHEVIMETGQASNSSQMYMKVENLLKEFQAQQAKK